MVLKKNMKQKRLPRNQPSLGFCLWRQAMKRVGKTVMLAMVLLKKAPGFAIKKFSTWSVLMVYASQNRVVKFHKYLRGLKQKKITEYFRRKE